MAELHYVFIICIRYVQSRINLPNLGHLCSLWFHNGKSRNFARVFKDFVPIETSVLGLEHQLSVYLRLCSTSPEWNCYLTSESVNQNSLAKKLLNQKGKRIGETSLSTFNLWRIRIPWHPRQLIWSKELRNNVQPKTLEDNTNPQAIFLFLPNCCIFMHPIHKADVLALKQWPSPN